MSDQVKIKTIDAKRSIQVESNISEPNQQANIVIVGAGLSGIAAAQKLRECGFSDVIVLDGQDRVGGRVFTIDHEDFLLELGAQWLHGAEENPLFNWLNERELLDDYEDASLSLSGSYCTSQGVELSRKLVESTLDDMVEIKNSFTRGDLKQLIADKSFTNALQVFKFKMDELFDRMDGEESKKDKLLIKALFDWFMRYESIENCCDSMKDVSIASYTDWTDFSDGDLLNFKHGYRSLLYWFCDRMPCNEIIHLNKPVANIEILTSESRKDLTRYIDRSGSPHSRGVLIRYLDNNKEKFVECNHAIVTVSIGVLKENLHSLFTPRLPAEKENLVNSIGFGTVNKIILQFEKPFLMNNDYGIKLVWTEESESGNEFPAWARDIISFDCVRKQPNLLIGWIGGSGAKQMELETDQEVARVCLNILRKFLPSNYNQPSKLVACICSRWYSNKFTRGSYSFQSDNSFENLDQLHEPIYTTLVSRNGDEGLKVPRLMFAGEATAGNLYSTAHGAIISGWREAERIKDFYKDLELFMIGDNISRTVKLN